MTPDEQKSSPGRILLVSEDKHTLDSLAQMLGDEFPVETASGCTEGMANMHLFGPFAIVAADMRMTGLDGTDFLARVRALAPQAVGILLAGRRDLHRATAAHEAGLIFRILPKPCERDPLLDAIRLGMDRYRANCEAREREQAAWAHRLPPASASSPPIALDPK